MGSDESSIKIANKTSKDIVISKVDIQTLAVFDKDNNPSLEIFRENLNEAHKKLLEKIIESESRRITKRPLRKGFRKSHHDLVDEKFFDEGYFQVHKKKISEIFPIKDLEQISKISDIYLRLLDIKKDNDIFLKYFFLTTENDARWEKFTEEVVPVTESYSVLFGMSSKTIVRDFHKTAHEKGRSRTENIQMISSTIKEEHIDFYIKKIISHVNNFNHELAVNVKTLKKYLNQEEIKVPDYLNIDVDIMNHCIESLKHPYSAQTGVFAIQLNTALLRIGGSIEGSLKRLSEEANNIIKNTTYPSSNTFKYAAERLGFHVEHKARNGYQVPKFAIREISI